MLKLFCVASELRIASNARASKTKVNHTACIVQMHLTLLNVTVDTVEMNVVYSSVGGLLNVLLGGKITCVRPCLGTKLAC